MSGAYANRRGGRPPSPACKVDGCGRTSVSRLMCAKHYARWRRHGSVAARPRRWALPDSEVQRLRRMLGIDPEGPSRSQKMAWTKQERLCS